MSSHKWPHKSTTSKSMQFSGEHLALNKNVEALDNNLERSNLRILIPDEHPAMIKSPTWVENKIEPIWESNFIPSVDIYKMALALKV